HDPELRVFEPALARKAQDCFGLPADELEAEGLDVRLPENGAAGLDDVAIALLGAADRVGDEDLFRPLALRDVEGDALQEQGPPALVLDQARLTADPHDTSVPGEEAALGPERPACPAAARELGDPELTVLGVKLAVPEEGILEPLLLAEPQQRLDVRADVDLVLALAEDGHERHRRNLFDERAVPDLGRPQARLRVGPLRERGRGAIVALGPRHVLDPAGAGREQRRRELGEEAFGARGIGGQSGELGGERRLVHGGAVAIHHAGRRSVARQPRSHAYQASSPAPPVAETASVSTPGFTEWTRARHRSRSNATCGARSILLSSTSPAARNMWGYFVGLSSPSGTEATTTLTASPRSNSAGQTRLPTFSIRTTAPAGGSSSSRARATMAASR